MQTLKATVKIFLDKRSIKKGDKYSIKISVYFDGEKRRYPTGIDLSQSEWDKLWATNLRDDSLKQKKRKIEKTKEKIEEVIEPLVPFSFSDFESFYLTQKIIRKTILIKDVFDEYIKTLDDADRVGTSISYTTTKNSLFKYTKRDIRITEIDSKFLAGYEKHLALESKSLATIGIYMRQLRRIINYSISKGIYPKDKYPFKDYVIPTSRNTKKALNENQTRLILNYKVENIKIQKAVDFWVFSYISNGMNMADICLLLKTSLKDEFFSFFRAKTKNTKKRDLRPIKVALLDRSKQIIERWRNLDEKNPYLFPILEPGLNARQIKFRIQDFIKKVNEGMAIVAKELEIPVKVRTYEARHTHSTILKRKGASTEMIKENLGHSSVLTTENYLDDFEDEVKQEFAKKLLDL